MLCWRQGWIQRKKTSFTSLHDEDEGSAINKKINSHLKMIPIKDMYTNYITYTNNLSFYKS